MKTNMDTIVMIVAIVLGIIVLNMPVGLTPFLNITLKVILIIGIYLLFRIGCCYKDGDSKILDIDSGITGLKESLDRIGKKLIK